MTNAAGHSPETKDGSTSATSASADRERILLLECRLEQLRSALDEARANADRVRASLAEASAREADHARRHGLLHQELAEARAEIASLYERLGRSEALRAELEGHLFEAGARGDAAELVRLRRESLAQRERSINSEQTLSRVRARMDELRVSREALLTRVAEWQRLIRIEGPEAVDLSEFMAELRRDIQNLEHRNDAGQRQEAALRERLAQAGVDPDPPSAEGVRSDPTAPALDDRSQAGTGGTNPEGIASTPAHLQYGESEAEEPSDAEASVRARWSSTSPETAAPETAGADAGTETEGPFDAVPPTDALSSAEGDLFDSDPAITTEGEEAIEGGAVAGSEDPAAAVPENARTRSISEPEQQRTGEARPESEGATSAAELPRNQSEDEEPGSTTELSPSESESRVSATEPPPNEPEGPVSATGLPSGESEEPEGATQPPPSESDAPTAAEHHDTIEGMASADPTVRAAACERIVALLQDEPSQLVRQLRVGLDDPDPRVRRRAVLAAATVRKLELPSLLEPLREDRDPQVRRVVREVLRHTPHPKLPADRREGAFASSAGGPRETSP